MTARMQEALLGGVEHFPADRAACRALHEVLPGAKVLAARSRRYLDDTVDRLATSGIAQFIELGCGLPRLDNVHTIARRRQPSARTVYLDNDPVVLAQACAQLEESDQELVVGADLRAQAVDLTPVHAHLDPGLAVAVLAVGLLEHLPDDAVRALVGVLPAGSTLVVSTLACEDPVRGAAIDGVMHRVTPWAWGRVRDAATLSALVPGLHVQHADGDGTAPYLAQGIVTCR